MEISDTNVLPFPELCTAWAGWMSLAGGWFVLLWKEVRCTDELVPDLGVKPDASKEACLKKKKEKLNQ